MRKIKKKIVLMSTVTLIILIIVLFFYRSFRSHKTDLNVHPVSVYTAKNSSLTLPGKVGIPDTQIINSPFNKIKHTLFKNGTFVKRNSLLAIGERGEIKSPYDGYVFSHRFHNNIYIKIITDDLKNISNLSEYDYNKLHNNSYVYVKSIYSTKKYKEKVEFISPNPENDDNQNYSKYSVIVSLKNKKFINGQHLSISYISPYIKIPKSSITNNYVFLYEDGIAKKRKINYINSKLGYVNVLSGIRANDKVIDNSQHNLNNNERVKTN